MQLIVEYEILIIKSITVKLYGFRKKMCFHEIRILILSFFIDTIVIIKFRSLLKGILVKSVFVNLIFDLIIYR